MTAGPLRRALLIGFVATLFWAPRSSVAQTGKPITRLSEPVIVSGAALRPFLGRPIADVGVWAWDGAGWHRVASQIDQRDEAGTYAAQDGTNVLDANDDLVFMADSLGVEADADTRPAGVAAASAAARITVSDPLAPAARGYAYVFGGASPAPPDPLVTYDPAAREIHSASYTVGLSAPAVDGFLGLKRLSLMGDAQNRIDRTKIRVTVPTIGDFNEETLATFGGLPPLEPVIEGPVRLVLSPDGAAVAYAARASLFGLNIGQNIPLIPGLEFRVSLDLSANATGATYRDAYTPRELTIDGTPDTIQQLLLSPWRQITFEEGRLVMLATGPPTPLLVRNYYKDDATPDTTDTGDQMSYGDSGVSASSFAELAAVGFLGQMVVLSPEQAVTGPQLADQLANPLVIEVTTSSRAVYLPSLHQSGHTGAPNRVIYSRTIGQ